MVSECSGGGLSIASRDSDNAALAFIAISQFHFADDGNAGSTDLFYQFVLFRNARTLHHFICFEDLCSGVLSFFKFDGS